MNDEMIHVTFEGKEFQVPCGMTYGDIIKEAGTGREDEILLVMTNGKLRELAKKADKNCEITGLTSHDRIGMDTYKRSLNLLFLKAVYDLSPETGEEKVKANLCFSHSNGYYYEVTGLGSVDQTLAGRVKARMQALVDQKLPIHKEAVSSGDAREFFSSVGMTDKEKLFRYRRVSTVNLYELDAYRDYFYGYMVRDTGFLKYFDVTAYEGGLVLVLPDPSEPTRVLPFEPFPKIFSVQKQSENWANKLGINTVADLNDFITNGQIGHELLVAEALQESRISDIAKEIQSRGNVKFVMVAGPSSSGKTTFSRRLSIQLSAHGLTPHPISLDNFYLDRQYCPRDENGELDFECLESIDVPLIQQTLKDLMDGKEVELPRFNFLTGSREYKGDYLKLSEQDVLVIEGIHGLNAKLSENLPKECVFRVYISALTQLNVDEHNHIATTDGRLIRRMVRDYRTRGTNARETIERWPSVRRGEQKWIFPNQENADVMINSALIYELSVLKTYAEPLLFQVPEDCPEYLEAKRLLKFLDYFLGTPSESIPNNSILREFIGGSCFDV